MVANHIEVVEQVIVDLPVEANSTDEIVVNGIRLTGSRQQPTNSEVRAFIQLLAQIARRTGNEE